MTWEYLYKIDYLDGTMCPTNLIYIPEYKDNVMRMTFKDSDYFPDEFDIPDSLREELFHKEITYLEKVQKFNWAPKLINVVDREIYIEFHKPSLNYVLLGNQGKLPDDYKEQLTQIIKDLESSNIYKLTQYPHSFYLDNNTIKTIDFYACVDINDSIRPIREIESLIGKSSSNRFIEATHDGKIDFKIFYEQFMLNHSNNYWINNPMTDIYLNTRN
jgi:hypothetical protein